jgi:DNA-binding CsgD family transcriptional regulator
MQHLTSQDTQNLFQSIQALHALNDLSTFGVKALTIINHLIPSEVPQFHVTNLGSRQSEDIGGFIDPDLKAKSEAIAQEYWLEHPIAQNMPLTLEGAYTMSDFVTVEELHRLEGLYQQLMRDANLEDSMMLFLPPSQPQNWQEVIQSDATAVAIALNRNQRNFTERERLLLNLLRPHLIQAYWNAQHNNQLQQQIVELKQSIDHLGIIILDVSGKVQASTSQATQYLTQYFPPSPLFCKLPEHLQSWVNYQIACFTQGTNQVLPPLPLRIERSGKQLVLRLTRDLLNDRYVLMMEEHALALLTSLELLGLSQRESEVLLLVIQGKDNKAIATHFSVNISTIRKHLENIYQKLCVQSRTEAVFQALQKLGILNSQHLPEE